MTKKDRTDSSPKESDLEQSRMCFGNDCFPNGSLLNVRLSQSLKGKQIVQNIYATVAPPDGFVWDYHADMSLYKSDSIVHRGVCLKSERVSNGSIRFDSQDFGWEYEQLLVNKIQFFAMSELETAYWLHMLIDIAKEVEIPGYEPDRELRPFVYTVPLKGLMPNGQAISFFKGDSGLASGSYDDLFGPLLTKSELTKDEKVWAEDSPKTWGVVIANDHLEAERIALDRAQLTADVVNLALRTGVSHFKTRYEDILLEWNAEIGRSHVSLHPWVCLLEVNTNKGWVRTVPLVDRESQVNLEEGYERIKLFIEKISDVFQAGDIEDQTGQRELSDREQKLISGIQRSLRWLSVASNEIRKEDQFIATWISLESLLNSIEYPGVFNGKRKKYRSEIKRAIDELSLPKNPEEELSLSEELIKNRVFQNEWPLRTKLVLFAKSFGIQLNTDDSSLVGELQLLRSRILHGGMNDNLNVNGQLRRLQYLVERLILAASICGYEDLEEDSPLQLQRGEIGPQGGAMPLFIDNKRVPYSLRITEDKDGRQTLEFIVYGKIYRRRIEDILPIDDQ